MSIIEAAIYGKIQKLSGDLKPFTPEERKELEECKKQWKRITRLPKRILTLGATNLAKLILAKTIL